MSKILTAAVVALTLSGCATVGDLPRCEKFNAVGVRLPTGEPGILLDKEAMITLVRVMDGLWERTCKPHNTP